MLATHSHGDHFAATSVRRRLQSNARAAFIGPPDAAAQVSGFGGRTYAVDVGEGQRRNLEVNGITAPNYAQILRNFPTAVLFRHEMESWTMP